LPLRLIIQ